MTPGLNDPAKPVLLRIGSWSARARLAADADARLLDEIFKGSLNAPAEPEIAVDADLYWFAPSADPELLATVPPDGLVVTQTGPHAWQIATEALTLRIQPGDSLPQITISPHPQTLDRLARRVHVSVVFHKLLFLLGRLYFHGGAVAVRESASAFIAEKWSGKSSICMWLGRAGATILSDDHIVIRRTGDTFQVSGCETVARVTEATEAALFPSPLPGDARDFAGVLKKEFPVHEQFAAMPYRDVPLSRVFFPHVGTRFQITSLAGRVTLARLLEATRRSHRFSDAQAYAQHLEFFSGLAGSVEAFDLELCPDMNELDRLVEFLGL